MWRFIQHKSINDQHEGRRDLYKSSNTTVLLQFAAAQYISIEVMEGKAPQQTLNSVATLSTVYGDPINLRLKDSYGCGKG